MRPSPAFFVSEIKRAAHGARTAIEEVHVNLRGFDILVAEQFLGGADVGHRTG